MRGALVGLDVLGRFVGEAGQTGGGVGRFDGMTEEGENVGKEERTTKGVKVG